MKQTEYGNPTYSSIESKRDNTLRNRSIAAGMATAAIGVVLLPLSSTEPKPIKPDFNVEQFTIPNMTSETPIAVHEAGEHEESPENASGYPAANDVSEGITSSEKSPITIDIHTTN